MTRNEPSSIDVSMVVNIHAGAAYLRRTMDSLEASALTARRAGVAVELLLALDRSPPETRSWVQSYASDAFDAIRIIELDNGSLGLSRQDGLETARGRYVQFCDEDDLVSSNTTLQCFLTTIDKPPTTIVVPEYLYGFGSKHLLAVYFGSEHIPPLAFLAQHPYVSRLFVHRDISKHVRFTDVRLGPGYAFEDWHFNATAVAAGCRFTVAPEVILFYRHRANSLSANMSSQSARLIPPTPLFEPRTYLALNAVPARELLRKGQAVLDPEAERARFILNDANRAEVLLANRIDPAVTLHTVQDCPIVCTANGDFATGLAYFDACRRVVGQSYSEVGLMETRPGGEAVQAALNALAEIDDTTQSLIITDDPGADLEHRSGMLRNATVINLARLGQELSQDQRHLIAFRLIEMVAPQARLHLNADNLSARFLERYGRLVQNRRKIAYRNDDSLYAWGDMRMFEPASFDFLSEFLDDVQLVVHTSQSSQERDRVRLDRRHDIWRQVYSPIEPEDGALEQDHLARRGLAVGFSPVQQEELERLCQSVGLTLEDWSVTSGDATNHDVVLVGNSADVTYREILSWMARGMVVIGPPTTAMAEIAERYPAVDLVGGTASAELEEYAAAILRFYRDAGHRRRLIHGIRTLIGERHSSENHCARIRDILLGGPILAQGSWIDSRLDGQAASSDRGTDRTDDHE
jgi:glycosyltransferase involved in cell wall biosynthesis